MISKNLARFFHWKHGSGQHSGAEKESLVPVVFLVLSDAGTPILIRQAFFKVSSQWIVGKNVTMKADIIHKGLNCLQMFAVDGSIEFLTLVGHDMNSYIPLSAFRRARSVQKRLTSPSCDSINAKLTTSVEKCSWKTIKHTTDKVQKHVCGHSSYFNMKLLLIKNDFWNDAVKRYLTDGAEKFAGFCHTSMPQNTRRVPLSSLSLSVNELVCIVYVYLLKVCSLHVIDSVTRYSS